MKPLILLISFSFSLVCSGQIVLRQSNETISDAANNKKNKIRKMERKAYTVFSESEKLDTTEIYYEIYNTKGEPVELLSLDTKPYGMFRSICTYENGNCNRHLTNSYIINGGSMMKDGTYFNNNSDVSTVDTVIRSQTWTTDQKDRTIDHTWTNDAGKKYRKTRQYDYYDLVSEEITYVNDTDIYITRYDNLYWDDNIIIGLEYIPYDNFKYYRGQVEYTYGTWGKLILEEHYTMPYHYYHVDSIGPFDHYYELEYAIEYKYRADGSLEQETRRDYKWEKKKLVLDFEEITQFNEKGHIVYYSENSFETKDPYSILSTRFQFIYNDDGSIREQTAADENGRIYKRWTYHYSYFE